MTITLKSFDYHSPLFYEAVAIYCAVWERDEEDSTLFFRRYARMTDFIGYVALSGKQPVGMGFGTLSESGQWWHDKVSAYVGTNHPALQDAWVLTELAVLPAHRNHSIGGILHDRVICEQPHSNVLLSTQVENVAAQRFYKRRGWTMLHDGFPFRKGCRSYCIMHKDMRDVR